MNVEIYFSRFHQLHECKHLEFLFYFVDIIRETMNKI